MSMFSNAYATNEILKNPGFGKNGNIEIRWLYVSVLSEIEHFCGK